tara:strand:- start:408 stop:641 length:234 start_codon:yes stop_codon:yes gene_type:complete
MGQHGEDIQLSPAARKFLPFSFECKKYAAFSVYTHYKQASVNSTGHTPILVIEANRQKPLVVMAFDDWLCMAKELNK